jgi:hypothetical protein
VQVPLSQIVPLLGVSLSTLIILDLRAVSACPSNQLQLFLRELADLTSDRVAHEPQRLGSGFGLNFILHDLIPSRARLN